MTEKSPLITKCRDLNLEGYISCVCDGDFSVLGTGYSQEELHAAWQEIRAEYISLMEDQVLVQAEALRMEIIYWEGIYYLIVSAVDLLRKYRCEETIKVLEANGYVFPFSKDDPLAYQKDLDRTLQQAKAILVQVANSRHDLEALDAEVGKGSQPITRMDLMMNIMQFSKFMGYAIDLKTTMVDAYIAMRNLYYKELNQLKQ